MWWWGSQASSIAGGPVWGVHAAAWAEARGVVSQGVRGVVSGKHTLVYVCTCVEDNCPRAFNKNKNYHSECLEIEKLPLLALVPHRHRLAAAAPLRGRVWLVRWRQLFWGKRLLWYWGSRACKPVSRQARAAVRESGQMQGGLAEGDVEREVKRARGA